MPLDKAGRDKVVKYNSTTKYEKKTQKENTKQCTDVVVGINTKYDTQKKTTNERNSVKDSKH